MNEDLHHLPAEARHGDDTELDDLDTLFAAARTYTPADLGAADRFLTARRARGRQRRVWASAVLGLAAALGGLTLLRPAPALPASAAYSVYHSALGEGW